MSKKHQFIRTSIEHAVFLVYTYKTMNKIDPRLVALMEKHKWKGCYAVPSGDIKYNWRDLEAIIDESCEGRWDIFPGFYKFELATDAAWFKLTYG